MSCYNKRKSCHDKSCERFYNTTPQTFAADETITLQIAGSKVVDSGIAIETDASSFNVGKSGLYHIVADAIVLTTTAGSGTLRILKNGVPLPCSARLVSLPLGAATEIHTETEIILDCCCCGSNTFTFEFVSDTAAGSVISLCTGVLKLA